ncbi:MAG: hypothetical protein II485_05375, partial [Firmicutes bacterium]|nr:hypothetical protein [Bacillota bacterium]
TDIAATYKDGKPLPKASPLPPQPEYVLSPREAYFGETKPIWWEDAVGRISGEMIAPYPPGIPVIYPGERISQEVWDFLEEVRLRKGHLHGPADTELNTIQIIEE